MSWDATYEASPTEGDLVGGGNEAMQGIKTDVRTRVAKEHQFDLTEAGGQPLQGLHRQGSAKAWYVASDPTTRPDGATALTSDDAGRLSVDSATLEPKVYTGSAWSKLKVTLSNLFGFGTNWATALAATLNSSWLGLLSGGPLSAKAFADVTSNPFTSAKLSDSYNIWNSYDNTGYLIASSSYTKYMEITCPYSGYVWVRFRLSFISGANAYGRIYKDGVAVGTERDTNLSSVKYDEKISVAAGNKIQIYGKTSGSGSLGELNVRGYLGPTYVEYVS